MRIVVHGQKAFGKVLLERLIERGENVVAVCSAPTIPREPEDPLVALAREEKIPVHQPKSWKSKESIELMRSFDADLCMMAYVLLFVPEAVLNAPNIGTFQYHPSLLPHHRGPSSISWPIAMGKTKTGLSIFWPNDGLDEGSILMTKSCDIAPTDTLSNIYFDKLFPMGIEAMLESLDLVKAGVILKYTQDLSMGSYESWYTKELAQIDWNNSVDEVYNRIRAVDPSPGAWSNIKSQSIDFYSATKNSEVGKPGSIISISSDGILIAAQNGSILVQKMRLKGDKKKPSLELANKIGLKVGDNFESLSRES